MIEDIIKLSKLDEGSVEIKKEEVDLYELSREIISRLSMQASMKHVHVSLSGEPVTYVGIRQILDEMIYNICENAIKYNVEGGSVSVWDRQHTEWPKVQVEIPGSGYRKSIRSESLSGSTEWIKVIPKSGAAQGWDSPS